jgi:hypothetical protein
MTNSNEKSRFARIALDNRRFALAPFAQASRRGA